MEDSCQGERIDLYSGELAVCTASAVALLDLASYLGCKAGFEEVHKFIRDDLSEQTSPVYIREASKYGADKIFVAALEICATNFEIIEPELLLCLPPDLFVGLVTGSGFECDSELFSERVVSYLEKHVDEVNGNLVGVLTSSKLMPCVDIKVALQLLRIGLEHGVVNEDGAQPLVPAEKLKADSNKKDSAKEEAVPAMVALKQRCFEALHENYDELRASNLDGLPADVTIALLKGGLDAAASAKVLEAKRHGKVAEKYKETTAKIAKVREQIRSHRSRCPSYGSCASNCDKFLVTLDDA